MFMWVSCGCWVVRNTTVLQETLFIHAFFGEGIVTVFALFPSSAI